MWIFLNSLMIIMGTRQGNDCLIKVAQTIKDKTHRPGDVAARYGGEEFVVLLSNTKLEVAIMIAGKIKDAIEELRNPS